MVGIWRENTLMFVVNGSDYTIIVIGIVGALLFFAVQYALCCKAKKTATKLIPLYFILLLIVLAIIVALSESNGSLLDVQGLAAIVILVFALVFGIPIGAAWRIYKLRHKK
jgi:uncharacterized membrane protein